MNLFGSSTDTVDGKARSVLADLPEDPSPYEILKTVDQKAGENVDPDDVASTLCDLDDTVDAKLAAIEGEDVDQKEMRQAAGTIANQSDLSDDGAMQLLSAVASGDVDQAAISNLADDADLTDMGNDADTPDDPDSSTDTPDTDPDAGVDQKQDDDDDGGEGGSGPLDMLNDDARETVEEFAELAGKEPEECVEEVLGDGAPSGGDAAPAATDAAAGAPDRNAGAADQMADHDQKLEDLNLNERIADAVTSDDVIDEMAGAVAQKMADDDEFADNLVETVDQKGDFVTTDDTVVTAPSGESETVSEAGAITGGNGGDDE